MVGGCVRFMIRLSRLLSRDETLNGSVSYRNVIDIVATHWKRICWMDPSCNFVFSFRRSIPLFLYYCFSKCICIQGALFEITSLYDCCRCYEDRLWFFKSMSDQVSPFETIRFPFEHLSLWISCVISSEAACICLNLCFMKMLKCS